MIDTTFDLFVDLGATDAQCDFPVVYASGANGIAGNDPSTLAEDLEPLFECIVREVSRSYKCFLIGSRDHRYFHYLLCSAQMKYTRNASVLDKCNVGHVCVHIETAV